MVWGGASDYALTICDIFTVFCVNSSGILNATWFWYNESLFTKYRKAYQLGRDAVDGTIRDTHASTRNSKKFSSKESVSKRDIESGRSLAENVTTSKSGSDADA